MRTVLLLCLVLAAGGCRTPPIDPSAIGDGSLLRIHDAFEEIVEAAHDQPTLEWHSGWFGNMWVNFWGRDTLGLCYQWQEWVHQEIVATVEAEGWESCGVVVNMDTPHEHHAVVVFDPQRTRRERILETPETDPAFVLDAWRRGRADIYTMASWLTLPARITVPPELEELPSTKALNLPFRETNASF